MSHICVLKRRPVPDWALTSLAKKPGITPLEAQLLSSRGDVGVTLDLATMLATPMRDLIAAATRLHTAIEIKESIVVVADYDCDGATACAVAVAGLRSLGATVGYVVPDRMIHGYGISPSIVELALERYPTATVLVTVDNGILGHAGIAYAATRGLDVIVTDHHLPGDTLPEAFAVIDPACADCPSRLPHLAGVGVALWLIAAVKRHRHALGFVTPALNFLLPYVAIGTICDMVKLDPVNRRLITAGMDRMRLKQVPVGVAALILESGFDPAYLTTHDIGFGIGPRINAAGRLNSMETGIELLLTDDPVAAKNLAKTLTETNNERKQLQKCATDEASLLIDVSFTDDMRSIVRGSEDWHPGIVGLVASRLKEKHHRPVFAFALAGGMAKGSGRSIPGFHLKDALEEVARRAPGVLAKFGGHAMAAGATLTSAAALEAFDLAFTAIAKEKITEEMLEDTLWSDGAFPDLELLEGARVLRHPWGQGFAAPAFDDRAILTDVAPLGEQGIHWRVQAQLGGRTRKTTVVLFNQPEPPLGKELHLYLEPGLNTWKTSTSLQWIGRILA